MSAPRFVKAGSIRVPIFAIEGGNRWVIELRKFQRKNKTFTARDGQSAKQRAEEEALRIAVELNAGGIAIESLTPGERVAFARAQALAKRRGLDLTAAVTEWDTLRTTVERELPGQDIATVIAAGIRTLQTPTRKVGEVVAELLDAKGITTGKGEFDDRSARDYRVVLREFASVHTQNIDAISTAQIERWLAARKRKDGFELSPKRKNHILALIKSLFKFARSRGYIADKITVASQIERNAVPASKIPIFSVSEMQTLLSHMPEDWLPWPVLVGFNGLRVEECSMGKHAANRKDCLRWEDFDWKEREICVRVEVAKTEKSRRIPMHDNTWHWLKPWRESEARGPVLPRGNVRGSIDIFRNKLRHLLNELSLTHEKITPQLLAPWNNALRHSYGSYRFAKIRDIHKLASEMGDSPAMIDRHYHNPRPKSHADAWFSIVPEETTHQLILFPSSAKAP